MASEKQNGEGQAPAATPAPKELKIPEGDRYLFVRLSASGEFQVLYSDPFVGLALLIMCDEFLRSQIRKDFGIDRPPQQIAVPGLDIGSIIRQQRKFGGKG